jgi:Ca-activated chloride channel family protein
LKPIGGTAIEAALKEALSLRQADSNRPFVVIFLTDGLPTIGVTDENDILSSVKKNNEGRTRVFCFGIGHDVNTHLLDKITETTRASSQYVLPEEDLEVKVSNFYARIKDPVLVNPRLEWGDTVRITKVYPSPLPDLFRGEQVVVVGRYSGRGDVAVRLTGESNGRQRSLTHEVRFPDRASEHDFVPRLWATRRVGYLLDEIRLHGDNAELKEEVIDLARRYGIVTPYTAWLIVEDEARRGVSLRSQSLPTLQSDAPARDLAGRQYDSLMFERYGLAPVARSRSDAALKMAESPVAAIQAGQNEAARGFGVAPVAVPSASAPARPASPQATVVAATQQTQFVGGRAFYWNNDRWLDTTVQQQANAQRRQITVGSPEYFELARRHPESQAWLALGTRVEFALGNTIYEIQD